MSEDIMLMEMPGAFGREQHGPTRPDLVRFVIDDNYCSTRHPDLPSLIKFRVGNAQNNNDGQLRSVPLGVVLTGYRLLTTIVIVGIGIPKAVYSYYGQSLISPSLDWVGGIIFALLLFWLGVIEATRPEMCPSFFQDDLTPAILRVLRRDNAPRPLPGSVSHRPTFPIPLIPEISSSNSRGPLSPVTQRAVTRPEPLHPNTTPSVPIYNLSHPSIVMQEGPQPLLQNWSNAEVEDRQYGSSGIDDIYIEHSLEETGYSSSIMPAMPIPLDDTSRFISRGPPRRPEMTRGRTSQALPSIPCRLCGRLTPLYEVTRLGGFCSEGHKREWDTNLGQT